MILSGSRFSSLSFAFMGIKIIKLELDEDLLLLMMAFHFCFIQVYLLDYDWT